MLTRRNLIASSAIALTLSLPAFAQDKTVKIGVLAPVSGPAAADGQEMVNGAQLAVDELNAAGGIAGYSFEIVVGDAADQSAAAVATAAERLLGDREMGAIVTGYASGSNFEIEMMSEMEMIYLVSANSSQTRDIISEDPDAFPTVWSFTPSFDAYNTGVLPVIEGLSESGALPVDSKTIAIVSSDNPYSKTIADGLVESFGSAGWEITVNDLVPFGEVGDWRGFLAKVRQNPPAVVINTDYLSGNAAAFMSQFMEQPTNSLVFIQYAPSVPEFLELTKDKSTGVLYNLLGGVLPGSASERAASVTSAYVAAYGNEPGTYGPMLYEEVMLYADALKSVGDPEKRIEIGNYIGSASKQTSAGLLEFDPKTHLAVQGDNNIPLQFYQIQDGARVLFAPESYSNGEFMTPPWME
ncbi:ABC transporter substrate-binding protein [Roseobacter sp. N2S]|uniref:ABC transporter substrate-binding protein n=1 Tax=Roseobacter sp. N2S TaxID=2663844 RepID=UPI002854B2A2|nr:ABC transporter substrate-binding protein [Roseobacter sp. N2S]MDR6266780.1 branched-chain amino acid transport system substrate-binding protein [Roseobacter sp. N2S]